MASAVISLILEFIKMFFFFIDLYMKWSAEERQRFEDRIKILTGLIKEAATNKKEVINEKSYLSNLEWEAQKRFAAYKKATLDILKLGGGINDLSAQTIMGMDERIILVKQPIVDALGQTWNIEEKSTMIAKLITEAGVVIHP